MCLNGIGIYLHCLACTPEPYEDPHERVFLSGLIVMLISIVLSMLPWRNVIIMYVFILEVSLRLCFRHYMWDFDN